MTQSNSREKFQLWFVRILSIALIATFVSTSPWAAETPRPMDEAFRLNVERDPSGLIFRWDIAPGYYLYRDRITARDGQGRAMSLGTAPGTLKRDPGFGTTEVYYDKASATAPSNPTKISITYQGCQDGGLCYPPVTKNVDMHTLAISESGPFPTTDRRTAVDWVDTGETSPVVDADPEIQIDAGLAGAKVDRLLAQGGVPLLMLGFLGFGLLLAFTPCVFPLYPIVIAMLSRERETISATRGFLLSSTYAVGLALAFGLLGMAAAWSGQNLQAALQSPFAIGMIAVLFAVLAVSNFGLFELRLPVAMRNMFVGRRTSGTSFGSAAAMGFTSAFLVGPCVTAPLAGALVYIARSGDVMTGALALFALGLGKGLPLIVMATFGSRVMPRAGGWMERVRHGFGFLFLATAIYIATPLVDARFVMLLWALLCVAIGAYAGGLDAARRGSRLAARSMAIVSILWGVLLLIGFVAGGVDPVKPLAAFRQADGSNPARPPSKADFEQIASIGELIKLLDGTRSSKNPTLLYVTADWCVTCRTIERNLFPDSQVASGLRSVRLAMLDVSAPDAKRQALMKALSVVGPPTMLFFANGRKEAEGTRLVGEFSASDLAEAARKAKAAVR